MLKFDEAYKRLNTAQKQAVDTIEGPVLVVAGPGTGKTQVLALRIANILKETDTPADGILCLTFTNSGVRAMRERLSGLIGQTASRVAIATFHSFGMKVIEEFYEALSLEKPPVLLDDKDSVVLIDELLESNDWEYLRPRSGGAHNYKDLKSLLSLLKRERITPEAFLSEIEKDSDFIKNDPDSISSRGPSKGKLKKEAEERISRLERTKETVRFYELYEATKNERGLSDYDDVLEYIVQLMEVSDDARDALRERFLYVLVDEHQDSSGVQNEFLESVWGDLEKPNVFAVGDDRQLIYGFGGASLSHFERFREIFPGTKVIPLTENYRSTQTILDSADTLLQSSLVKEKLSSNTKETHPVSLVEAQYPRDEILAAGLEIKKKIEEGMSPNECAILVPKNAQAENAITVLTDLGIPVASGGKAAFFALRETTALTNLLRVLSNPYDGAHIAKVILDPTFGIKPLVAYKFLRKHGHKLSIDSLVEGEDGIKELGEVLTELANFPQTRNIYCLVQEIGERFFFKNVSDHDALLRRIEVVRTMLHLVLSRTERDPKLTLADFVIFIDRLEEYGQDIPLAVFGSEEGVRVMTLHGSKGLEFDFVWIAHMDEKSLMSGKRMGFTLPESLNERISKKDELTAKRELYVAITRAKRFCTLSYAQRSYTGGEQSIAKIISELPLDMFTQKSADVVEKEILAHDPKAYIASTPVEKNEDVKAEIATLVKAHYVERKLAVTHLNNFFSCPWKWYFRNFLSLPEPETESLQFGSVVHFSLESIFKDKITEKQLPEVIESQFDKLCIADTRTRERFMKDAMKILSRFMTERLPQLSGEHRSEYALSTYRDPEIENIEVTGKIDLVEDLVDKTLRVTDFKTGRPKLPREIEKRTDEGRMSDYLRQLSMYSYLLMHEKNIADVSASRLMFLETETSDPYALYETRITGEEIELLRKDIKDYDSLIQSGKWIDRECDFKGFGTQKECEYCALINQISA